MPRCPSCVVPMTRITEGTKRFTCSKCMGTWLQQVALQAWVRNGEMPAGPIQEMAAAAAASDSKRPLRCPECNVDMKIDRYQPLIPINIQRCGKCNSVWLDAGKFNLLRVLYNELMTSNDPEILKRRAALERFASTNLEFDGRAEAVAEHAKDMADVKRIVTRILGI